MALPFGAELKVRKGDKVALGQVLFEDRVDREKIINFQSELKGLSVAEIKELNTTNYHKEFKENEIIFGGKGWFPKKLVAPVAGTFAGIDDLLNLHIKLGQDSRIVRSPTDSTVGKIDDGELILEFVAKEYLGKGVNESRSWTTGIRFVKVLADLNFDCENKIILLEKPDESKMVKSEVVGVGAVVILDDDNLSEDVRINFKMPVLLFSREVYDEFRTQVGEECRALVNGSSGRLLLVVKNENN